MEYLNPVLTFYKNPSPQRHWYGKSERYLMTDKNKIRFLCKFRTIITAENAEYAEL